MKYTIEPGAKIEAAIADTARAKSISKGEVLRRAIALYFFFQKHLEPGDKICITDESYIIKKEVEIP